MKRTQYLTVVTMLILSLGAHGARRQQLQPVVEQCDYLEHDSTRFASTGASNKDRKELL